MAIESNSIGFGSSLHIIQHIHQIWICFMNPIHIADKSIKRWLVTSYNVCISRMMYVFHVVWSYLVIAFNNEITSVPVKWLTEMQRLFCTCDQPMRDAVTLAVCMHKLIPGYRQNIRYQTLLKQSVNHVKLFTWDILYPVRYYVTKTCPNFGI